MSTTIPTPNGDITARIFVQGRVAINCGPLSSKSEEGVDTTTPECVIIESDYSVSQDLLSAVFGLFTRVGKVFQAAGGS